MPWWTCTPSAQGNAWCLSHTHRQSSSTPTDGLPHGRSFRQRPTAAPRIRQPCCCRAPRLSRDLPHNLPQSQTFEPHFSSVHMGKIMQCRNGLTALWRIDYGFELVHYWERLTVRGCASSPLHQSKAAKPYPCLVRKSGGTGNSFGRKRPHNIN